LIAFFTADQLLEQDPQPVWVAYSQTTTLSAANAAIESIAKTRRVIFIVFLSGKAYGCYAILYTILVGNQMKKKRHSKMECL